MSLYIHPDFQKAMLDNLDRVLNEPGLHWLLVKPNFGIKELDLEDHPNAKVLLITESTGVNVIPTEHGAVVNTNPVPLDIVGKPK